MRQWILVNIVVIMLEDDISLKEMIFLYKKTQPECKLSMLLMKRRVCSERHSHVNRLCHLLVLRSLPSPRLYFPHM